MVRDKYNAVWVSHSSMGDFLKCPRAYYLHNVYKDPKTGRKMSIVNPALSLGQAVHETLEAMKYIPVEERKKHDLLSDLEIAWAKISGKRGGFKNRGEEDDTKSRARAMIERVVKNPGPLAKKTVRLPNGRNDMPPNFYLSDDDNIILCGLVDWLEYIEVDDSVKIIDFKTGKNDEVEDSLQIPIYLLILNALQKRKVSGAAYWYLDRSDFPQDVVLPDLETANKKVLSVARRVQETRVAGEFYCPRGTGGCFYCRPFEMILRGEMESVGVGGYGQDLYIA